MPSLLLKMSMVDEHSMVDSTLTDQTEMLLVILILSLIKCESQITYF